MCGETPSGSPARCAEPVEAVAQAADAERRRRDGSGRSRSAPAASRRSRAVRAAPAGRRRGRPSSARAGRTAEQADPLLAALAEDPDLAAPEIERAEIGRGELADPQAGRIGRLDERPVPQRERHRERGPVRAVPVARRDPRRWRRAAAPPARPRGLVAGGAAGAAWRSRPTGRRAPDPSRVAQRWNDRIAARRWATEVRACPSPRTAR